MVAHKPTSVKIKKPRRFPEIGAQAKALKISRYHLWNVLTGRRVSPTLLARYEALTGKPHVFPAPAAAICPTSDLRPLTSAPSPVAPPNETPKGPTE